MEHQDRSSAIRWWSGEHRAALHRLLTAARPMTRASATSPPVDRPAETSRGAAQLPVYHAIRHADGRVFYDGAPVTLADAQIMLNDAIADARVEVGSFLRVDSALLVIEPPDALSSA